MLIRKKLTEVEFSNPALRYNEGCDCVQFSPDGGTTWIDNPGNDPRASDVYRLPPLTGSDTQCRAAEGMTAFVRSMVDARIEDISDAELVGAILGLVSFIPGFNVLYAIILAFVTFAATIAREILEAAFTEPVYDTIRCVFFCNIDEDGQMSQAQFDAAYADMLAQLDTVARIWVHAVMNMVGPVGMSNAGVALEAEADCSECECDHCFTLSFEFNDGTALGWTASGGTYVTGAWQGVYVNSGSQSDLWGYWTFPEVLNVVSISVEFYKGGGSGGTNVNNFKGLNPVVNYTSTQVVANTSNPTDPDARLTKTITVNDDLAGIGIDINSGSFPTTVQIYSFTVVYRGDEVFGGDNCE